MFRCQVSRSAGQPDPDCLKRFFWGTTYVLYDTNRRRQKCIFGNFSSYRVAGLSKLRCRACLAPLSVGDFVSVTSLIVNFFFFSFLCLQDETRSQSHLSSHPALPFLYWSRFVRPSILTLGTRMGKIDFLRVPIFLPKKARTMMYFFILLANSQPLSLITCPPAPGFGLIPGCQSIVPANCISYYYA